MSILATVLIAIAALVIGFIVGGCVGVNAGSPNVTLSTEPNPVQTFNAEPPISCVKSKIVLPKRISKAEFDKKVNACLKDVVTETVNVFGAVSDKTEKQRIIKSLYSEWQAKLHDAIAYSKFNPDFQRLDILGHKTKSGSLMFYAVWSIKAPYDCISYARRHK